MKVELKGIAKVTAKGRRYYYAWRGGPRLRGEPGSAEFVASFQEAHEQRRSPSPGRFQSLVTRYKASTAFRELAPSTRKNWGPWLDRIAEHFGELRIAQFNRSEKIRPVIRGWRNSYADRPRAADYGLQVLSRVCAYGVDPLGELAGNPCEGIAHLYKGNRSERIWTDAEVAQLKMACSAEIGQALDLAVHTGLRLGDLLRLSWSHVKDDEIVMPTGKSRHRREAFIPIYNALRGVLTQIPKRATTVLTSGKHHRPWTKDGFSSSFNKAKIAAGLASADLHFHDTRGSAATKFYIAGLSQRVIAEIMGWDEEQVARIIRRYVGRSAATKAIIAQLNKAERGT